MSKGSGMSGNAGGSSGSSGSSRGKVKNNILGEKSKSGKSIQGLISGRGGISKSSFHINPTKLAIAKSVFKGLTKSQVISKSKTITSVKININHITNVTGGGGSVDVIGGGEDVVAAKSAGATHINASVTQVSRRGRITTWTGLVKL